jgi:hypothetical protein
MLVDHKTKKIQSIIIPSPSAIKKKVKKKRATVSTSPQFDDLPSPSPKEKVKGEKKVGHRFSEVDISKQRITAAGRIHHGIHVLSCLRSESCRDSGIIYAGGRGKNTLCRQSQQDRSRSRSPHWGGLLQSSKEKRGTPVRYWMHWFTKHSSLQPSRDDLE